jgi:RimJ/RimL family protein N-acetyltransferase
MAIELDGRVVGGIGLGVNAHGYRGSIGYWMAERARGQGICTRALRLLTRHALEDLRLQSVQLATDPDNVASQRVAEKVGFQREGVLRAHLRHPDGRIRDSVMFSLLPGELRE